jgi:anti-anti-sigma factor
MNDELILQQATPQDADTAVTKPDGDLVAAHLPPFRSRLAGMVTAGIRHLTLDLAGVSTIDSVGIGLLVSVHNSLRRVGGELKLIHVSQDILALFQAMRINQHFSVSGN